jgi:hypothetical protein
MKKALLGLIIVAGLAAVVAIQFDWLNINPTEKGVNIEVDKEKAKKDLKTGVDVVKSEAKAIGSAAKELGKELMEKVKGTEPKSGESKSPEPAPAEPPPTTPKPNG